MVVNFGASRGLGYCGVTGVGNVGGLVAYNSGAISDS
jgi:hypothetical protein